MKIFVTKVGKPFTSKKNGRVYIMCDTIDPDTGDTGKQFFTPSEFDKFFNGKGPELVGNVSVAVAELDVTYNNKGFIEDVEIL